MYIWAYNTMTMGKKYLVHGRACSKDKASTTAPKLTLTCFSFTDWERQDEWYFTVGNVCTKLVRMPPGLVKKCLTTTNSLYL